MSLKFNCCRSRQIIARGLLDVFRDFSHNEEDYLTVMAIVVRLSEDTGEFPFLSLSFLDCFSYGAIDVHDALLVCVVAHRFEKHAESPKTHPENDTNCKASAPYEKGTSSLGQPQSTKCDMISVSAVQHFFKPLTG